MTKLLLPIFGGLKLGKVLLVGGHHAGVDRGLRAVLRLAVRRRFRGAAAGARGRPLPRSGAGLDVGLPTFIPFVGAWIQLKEMPHDAETEAYVGASPGRSSARSARWPATRPRATPTATCCSRCPSTGFFLNLFNMIPLSPFDGGRITAVLSPRIWFAGVPVLIALFVYRPVSLLIVMAIPALPQLKRAWRYDPDAPENRVLCDVDRDEDDVRALLRGPARVPRADDVRRARHAARRAFVDLTADI